MGNSTSKLGVIGKFGRKKVVLLNQMWKISKSKLNGKQKERYSIKLYGKEMKK